MVNGEWDLKELRLTIITTTKKSKASFFIIQRLWGGSKGIFVKTFVCQVIVISPFAKSFSFD